MIRKGKIRLGGLELPNRAFYSPLAGCSDYPFRKMAARWRPGLMFCEMVKMDALVRNDPATFHLLDYSAEMHPLGGQIVGGKAELAGPAAKILEDLGFDVVDLNCGCPVDKVTKDGSGSGLLKEPGKVGEMISNMVASVNIPVTVKIRIGWDDDNINAPELVRVAEEAGAAMISIHGRTRSQGYKGLANRELIRESVDQANTILVAGNGDIFDAESALDMFERTGCDVALASRGTMGQPWIAEDMVRAMDGLPPIERTTVMYLETLLEHIDEIVRYRNDRRAAIDIRRVGCWYCKNAPGIGELRGKLARTKCPKEARRMVMERLQQEMAACRF